MDDNILDEAIKLTKTKKEGRSKKELRVSLMFSAVVIILSIIIFTGAVLWTAR